MDDEQIELSADRAWQDQANCLGVDPDLFFRSEEPPPAKPRKSARAAWCAMSALNTPSPMARNSASGAVCRSVSAASSVASARRPRATSLALSRFPVNVDFVQRVSTQLSFLR